MKEQPDEILEHMLILMILLKDGRIQINSGQFGREQEKMEEVKEA